MYEQVMLLDPDIDLNEMSEEEVAALIEKHASESHIAIGEKFVHRGKEYILGSDISPMAARMICLAEWVDHKDRLWFAHALFEKYMSKPKWWREAKDMEG